MQAGQLFRVFREGVAPIIPIFYLKYRVVCVLVSS